MIACDQGGLEPAAVQPNPSALAVQQVYGDLGTGMKVVAMVQQQRVYMDVGGTCSQKEGQGLGKNKCR